jgi:hypothetical protein
MKQLMAVIDQSSCMPYRESNLMKGFQSQHTIFGTHKVFRYELVQLAKGLLPADLGNKGGTT